MKKKLNITIILLILTIITGCQNLEGDFEIIDKIELKERIFVQGLEIYEENNSNVLYAGLGLNEDSRIVKINTQNGDIISLTDKNENMMGQKFFGEGITFTSKGLYQLTWKDRIGFIRNKENFEVSDTFEYDSEGWGLAFDRDRNIFYMSDGSSSVQVRDANTFSLLDKFDVGISKLNELEYVDGYLYSNVWLEDLIIKIDVNKKKLVKIYDFSAISLEELDSESDVLNGIAHIENNEFYITGRKWKNMYRVLLK